MNKQLQEYKLWSAVDDRGKLLFGWGLEPSKRMMSLKIADAGRSHRAKPKRVIVKII